MYDLATKVAIVVGPHAFNACQTLFEDWTVLKPGDNLHGRMFDRIVVATLPKDSAIHQGWWDILKTRVTRGGKMLFLPESGS